MVGLGVVLESQKSSINNNNKTHQIINKTTMMLNTINNKTSSPISYPSSNHHSHFQASNFLEQCFLCKKRLLLGKDIYMYKGDRAFCSVDCRCKQILTDEEEAIQKQNCSLDGFA
uniref:FCS-Like Zinc finger 15-like n=1 Tax=Cicer arietinum TaxID=3827 RepID=A0A1S2YQ69_CICAR|nr:FCS-Like Zinc finger 15-like [Cicer arietinum]